MLLPEHVANHLDNSVCVFRLQAVSKKRGGAKDNFAKMYAHPKQKKKKNTPDRHI